DRGYALVGSSYDPNGSLWALDSAVRDQFASLAAVQQLIGHPTVTLALGTSMGGLISALEAQQGRGRLDGVLSTCGLVGGGIDLNNYELDAEYALNRLLAPDQPVKLVGYADPGSGPGRAEHRAAEHAHLGTAAGTAAHRPGRHRTGPVRLAGGYPAVHHAGPVLHRGGGRRQRFLECGSGLRGPPGKVPVP